MAVISSDEQIIQGLNAASPSSLVLAQKKKYEEDEKEKNRQRQIIAFDFNDAEYEELDSKDEDSLEMAVVSYNVKRSLIAVSMIGVFLLSGAVLPSLVASVFVGVIGGLGIWVVGKGISRLISAIKNDGDEKKSEPYGREENINQTQNMAKFVFSASNYTFRLMNYDRLFFDIGITTMYGGFFFSGMSLSMIVLGAALGAAPLFLVPVLAVSVALLAVGGGTCWVTSYLRNNEQAPQPAPEKEISVPTTIEPSVTNAHALQHRYPVVSGDKQVNQAQPQPIAYISSNSSNQSYRIFSAASAAIALVGLSIFRKPQQQIEQRSAANASQQTVEQPVVRRMGKDG